MKYLGETNSNMQNYGKIAIYGLSRTLKADKTRIIPDSIGFY